MTTDESEWRVCSPHGDESTIRNRLESSLPELAWEQGDSSWDKIRVSGRSRQAGNDLIIRIFRREAPGPLELYIRAKPPPGADGEGFREALRDRVLGAIGGRPWRRLQPRSVSIVTTPDGFPAAYAFTADLTLGEIADRLFCNELWSWDYGPLGIIEGRIAFRRDGRPAHFSRKPIRISGAGPSHLIEVGLWSSGPEWSPTCAEVHEIVQTTLLPALGARDVRASAETA